VLSREGSRDAAVDFIQIKSLIFVQIESTYGLISPS